MQNLLFETAPKSHFLCLDILFCFISDFQHAAYPATDAAAFVCHVSRLPRSLPHSFWLSDSLDLLSVLASA